MALFLKWVLLAISFLLQITVFSNFNIFGVVSSFFFASFLYVVSEDSIKRAIAFGTTFGVLTDLACAKVFGINTALYLLIGIAVSFLASRMREKKLVYYLVIACFFTIVFEYISALMLIGSSMNVTMGYVFIHKVLPTALLNTLWMLFIYGSVFGMKKKGWGQK